MPLAAWVSAPFSTAKPSTAGTAPLDTALVEPGELPGAPTCLSVRAIFELAHVDRFVRACA